MKYINTFLNLSAFTEAKPNLPNPSLSLIKNTNQVYYIKKPLIKVTLNVPSKFNNKELPLGGFEYNEASSTTKQHVFPKELCEDVIIDGVSVGPINTYTFTAGKHIVEYAMKDETKVVDTQFFGFDILGIESVEIPDSVTSIGFEAFEGCTGLKTVDLTSYSKLETIGDHTFNNCPSLTSITIPDSVTSIGYGAFVGCSGLTSITIPERITLIGSYTFYNCSSLTEVTYKGKIYTSKRELLNDLQSNNVETGSYAFDNTGLGV